MNSIWIARDFYGNLYAYKEKPVKDKHIWNKRKDDTSYVCELDDDWFPGLRWQDEPIELVIKEKEDK